MADEDLKIQKPNCKVFSRRQQNEAEPDTLRRQAVACERPKPKMRYDVDIIQDMLIQSSRFKRLKPTALLDIMGERPKYIYLKQIAVARLEENFRQQFAILSQIVNKINDNDEEASQNDGQLHNVFSWKWGNFVERRKQKNFTWVDTLLRKEENHLYYLKYQTDIKELQFFLNKILQGILLYMAKEDLDIYQSIAIIVEEAKRTLHILDNIEKDYHTNSEELRNIVYKEYIFSDAKRRSQEKMLKSYLENRICNSHVLDPIEIRYQLNLINGELEETQYNIESARKIYEADTSQFKEMENRESFVNGSCLDYYYSSIEEYKNQLSEMQNKYDKDVEEMDTKLALLKLQIEKLKEQRKFLEGEIQRFQDEEKEMILDEEMNGKEM